MRLKRKHQYASRLDLEFIWRARSTVRDPHEHNFSSSFPSSHIYIAHVPQLIGQNDVQSVALSQRGRAGLAPSLVLSHDFAVSSMRTSLPVTHSPIRQFASSNPFELFGHFVSRYTRRVITIAVKITPLLLLLLEIAVPV